MSIWTNCRNWSRTVFFPIEDCPLPLCFDLPDCGHTEARVTITLNHKGSESVVTLPLDLPADVCSTK